MKKLTLMVLLLTSLSLWSCKKEERESSDIIPVKETHHKVIVTLSGDLKVHKVEFYKSNGIVNVKTIEYKGTTVETIDTESKGSNSQKTIYYLNEDGFADSSVCYYYNMAEVASICKSIYDYDKEGYCKSMDAIVTYINIDINPVTSKYKVEYEVENGNRKTEKSSIENYGSSELKYEYSSLINRLDRGLFIGDICGKKDVNLKKRIIIGPNLSQDNKSLVGEFDYILDVNGLVLQERIRYDQHFDINGKPLLTEIITDYEYKFQ